MEQIAVRNMQFNEVEPESRGTTCAVRMRLPDLGEATGVQCTWRGPAGIMRNR